ncbi:MAG TPA: LOG family protein [Ardenticatenaceae bacterium]|nr:LOG family protein [Ardenticatenaceae bacterium]
MIISVYGSAQPKPGWPLHAEAAEVGRLLAQGGYSVMTGGYDGTMAAVSQGAHEVGGHVIGVTLDLFDPTPPNPWIREEARYPDFSQRLRHFTEMADGFVVLRGGIGTLTEIFFTWGLMQTGAIRPPRPIVVLGAPWRRLFALLREDEFLIQDQHYDLIRWAESPADVVRLLDQALGKETSNG